VTFLIKCYFNKALHLLLLSMRCICQTPNSQGGRYQILPGILESEKTTNVFKQHTISKENIPLSLAPPGVC